MYAIRSYYGNRPEDKVHPEKGAGSQEASQPHVLAPVAVVNVYPARPAPLARNVGEGMARPGGNADHVLKAVSPVQETVQNPRGIQPVITSYSIHYTKLYECPLLHFGPEGPGAQGKH